MPDAIHEFQAALQPIAAVQACHQAHLVIKRGILPGDAAFEREVTRNGQKEKMSVIGDVIVKCFPPEIGFRFAGDHKLVAGWFRDGGLVEPFHFREKRFSRACDSPIEVVVAPAKLSPIPKLLQRAPQLSAVACERKMRRFAVFMADSGRGLSRLDADGINRAHLLPSR